MRLKELLDKRQIIKESKDPNKVNGSIRIAKHFLERAKGNQKMGFSDTAFLLAYTAMFHAARALLFEKEYKERGHFALVAALKDLYKDNGELQEHLNILDSYRLTRHAIQYNTELSNELDAAEAIKDADLFIKFVASLLKINSR